MLWVNLIMDTFAALALATEPSYKEVMEKTPRKVSDFIVNKSMMWNIFGQGIVFLAILLALLFHYKADGVTDIHELSEFFTIFVMLQFWNMFNARTLGGIKSAFYRLKENRSFLFIVGIILVLQVAIVQFGGGFFRTAPLSLEKWAIILSATSEVLWCGELLRFVLRKKERRA